MSYSYEVQTTNATGDILVGLTITWFIVMLACIFLLVCMYKVFKKAGRKGWEALIPIYNFIVIIQITELPMWYVLLYFIPFANIYAMFKTYIEFAHKFGKSTGFGVAMVLFPYVCLPMLAFGNAQYQGNIPTNNTVNQNVVQNNNHPIQNMGMDYNQSVGMNNSVVQNNNLQPEVQSVPLQTVEQVPTTQVNEVQPTPVVETPVIPVNEVQPTPVVETPASQVTNMQPASVVESPVIEPVQQTQVVEPTVTQPIATEPVDSKPVMTEPVQNKKFCPNCGNQVDQNDAICFMCGNKF